MKLTKEQYEATLKSPVAFHKHILSNPFELTEPQKAIFQAVAEHPETLVIGGSKGGKSTLSAEVTLWGIYRLLQVKDLTKKYGLNPGTNIYCMNIAPKGDLAIDIVLNYIKGYAEDSWYLSQYIENYKANEVHFVDHIIARAQGSSSKAGRGYAIYILVFDEFCYFIDTRGNLSGTQCVNAFMPRLLPFAPDSRFMGISTPAGRRGIAYDMFRTGKPMRVIQKEATHGEQPFRAVFQYATWELNPLYPRNHPFLQKEYKRDPWFFEREYGAKFADVVSAFLNWKQIKSCVEALPLPHEDKLNNYIICHDPGLSRDAYAIGLGHILPDGRVRIDMVKVWEPTHEKPVNMLEVEETIIDWCKRYRVTDIIGDKTRAQSTIMRLRGEGLPSRSMVAGAMTDIKIFQPLLELINMRGISLCSNEKMLNELKFLERITLANRYRVQASPGSTDDLADVVAMIAYVLKIEQTQGGVVLF